MRSGQRARAREQARDAARNAQRLAAACRESDVPIGVIEAIESLAAAVLDLTNVAEAHDAIIVLEHGA